MYEEEICLCGINGIFCKPHESQVDGKRNKGITMNMFSPTLFLGIISYKCGNKTENGIFCHIFLFLGRNLPKEFFWNFFITFPLDWGVGGGGSFLLDFYFLGQVLETCCHSMLNHSWDVHIWYNMRNLKKKIGFLMFAHCCGYNKSIENLLFMWKNVEYNVILKIFWNGYSEANSIITYYSSWEMFITILI